MTNKPRTYYLDVIRIFACLMVILMHSPSPKTVAEPNGTFLSCISFFTQPCIGLFFMVSGALLLPTALTAKKFLGKRLGRVIAPTVFWSVAYIALYQTVNGGGYSSTLNMLISIPFSAQGNGVLWFMYALTGFYLIIPIISPWLQRASKREAEFYIALFMLATAYPFLNAIATTGSGTGNILYYFASYGGYFLMGWYFSRHGSDIRLRYLTGAYITMLLLPAVFLLVGRREAFWEMINYLSLPVVVMTAFWFRLWQRCSNAIAKLSDRTKTIIAKLSSLSFGVYLIHIAVMRYFIWNQEIIISIPNHAAQTVVIFLLTTTISFALIWLISKLKFSKYIIG